ncbi:MAG: hypothetical protein ACOC6J_00860 [Spirochaetota bacterium]
MKRTTILSAIAALVIVTLAGCYVGYDDGAGSVGIPLPDPRTVSQGAAAEYARIFVLNGAILLELGEDTPFEEFDLTPSEGQTLSEATVGPVPAGDGYRIVLVFGDYQTGAGGDYFVPSEYALSDPFTVHGGQATAVDAELGPTPFVGVGGSDILGLDLKGIVFTGTNLYVADPDTLYQAVATPADFETGVSFGSSFAAPGGRTINSITLGAMEGGVAGPTGDVQTVWLNTTQGLLPFVGSTFDSSFDDGSELETTSILDSGAFILPADYSLYGYVQFDGGLSAVRDFDGGSGPDWMKPTDLSDLVSGQPIYDLAVQLTGSNVYGYFATKLGAFRMPDTVISDDTIDTAQEVFESSDFFEVSINGTKAVITQIAIDPSGSGEIYLGTPRGAVRVPAAEAAKIGSEDNVPLDATLIPGTEGLIVEDIVMGGDYVVVLTNHFLVYSTNGGDSFASAPLPVYASSAGTVNEIFLDTSGGVVLLAGSSGLAGVDIDGP